MLNVIWEKKLQAYENPHKEYTLNPEKNYNQET